jgi:AraC-like DNA-binding protein
MNSVQHVHRHWQPITISATPQILLCAYFVLNKWEYENLVAPFWRWYYNDAPGAFLVMDNKRIPIEPGLVILIPPHTVFGSYCEETFGHLHMHFTLGLDRTVTPGRIFKHAPADAERAMIRRLIHTIKNRPDSPDPRPRLSSCDASSSFNSPTKPERDSLLASFLAQAVLNPALSAVPADYWEGCVPDKRMTQALQRLREDGLKADNATLAREAGMNTSAFIRKFRQAIGHTPHQYRLRLSIEQACGWLRMDTLTMDQIAEAAGFCDRYHFSRVFKQIMGMTPVKFRDDMKPTAD